MSHSWREIRWTTLRYASFLKGRDFWRRLTSRHNEARKFHHDLYLLSGCTVTCWSRLQTQENTMHQSLVKARTPSVSHCLIQFVIPFTTSSRPMIIGEFRESKQCLWQVLEGSWSPRLEWLVSWGSKTQDLPSWEHGQAARDARTASWMRAKSIYGICDIVRVLHHRQCWTVQLEIFVLFSRREYLWTVCASRTSILKSPFF